MKVCFCCSHRHCSSCTAQQKGCAESGAFLCLLAQSFLHINWNDSTCCQTVAYKFVMSDPDWSDLPWDIWQQILHNLVSTGQLYSLACAAASLASMGQVLICLMISSAQGDTLTVVDSKQSPCTFEALGVCTGLQTHQGPCTTGLGNAGHTVSTSSCMPSHNPALCLWLGEVTLFWPNET